MLSKRRFPTEKQDTPQVRRLIEPIKNYLHNEPKTLPEIAIGIQADPDYVVAALSLMYPTEVKKVEGQTRNDRALYRLVGRWD